MENQACLVVCVCLKVPLSDSAARRLMQNHNKKPQESLWLCYITGLQLNTECVIFIYVCQSPIRGHHQYCFLFHHYYPAETRETILENLKLK